MGKDPDRPSCSCGHSSEDPGTSDGGTRKGMTRRGFLASLGAGAAVAAAGNTLPAEAAPLVIKPEELTKVTLQINGRAYPFLVEPRWTLLYVIREKLALTGTKVGCERGECGACTVLIDSLPHYACMMPAVEAEGREVITVEGLMHGKELGPVQQAFVEEDAFQCGYCTSGQIIAVEGLLRKNPEPSMEVIRAEMSGNLCRCGAYHNIFKAANRSAKLKSGKGGKS
jgi:xanthine dehydrogenase YagT iron-sulfur-binding subunit